MALHVDICIVVATTLFTCILCKYSEVRTVVEFLRGYALFYIQVADGLVMQTIENWYLIVKSYLKSLVLNKVGWVYMEPMFGCGMIWVHAYVE